MDVNEKEYQKLIFDIEGEFAINFQWKEEEPHWVNFSGVEVCSDYMDKENPKFITFDTGYGISSNCYDFKEVKTDDLFFSGHIKWDGCMEIHELTHHFCYKNNILQRVTDLIYNSAKEIMKSKADFD